MDFDHIKTFEEAMQQIIAEQSNRDLKKIQIEITELTLAMEIFVDEFERRHGDLERKIIIWQSMMAGYLLAHEIKKIPGSQILHNS